MNTCGNCIHWHGLDRPERYAGPVLIEPDSPAQGQCRHSPPSVTTLPGPQGVIHLTAYPQLPATYAACGQFSPAEVHALAGTNGKG